MSPGRSDCIIRTARSAVKSGDMHLRAERFYAVTEEATLIFSRFATGLTTAAARNQKCVWLFRLFQNPQPPDLANTKLCQSM